jgi:hypothetical protein
MENQPSYQEPGKPQLQWKIRDVNKNNGGDESKIYCKHFCKCHDVPPVQQWNDSNNNKRELLENCQII